MDEKEKQLIVSKTGDVFESGYHCSEAVFLGVGGNLLGELHSQAVRLTTPFAGGVGSTNLELCGALTGALMVIGGLHGRTQAGADDTRCQELAAAYRAAFLQRFGWLKCQDLKEHWIGNCGQPNCRALVEGAARLLLELLDGQPDSG
jgi:C_GCAxxG_C_C family probable redox protein